MRSPRWASKINKANQKTYQDCSAVRKGGSHPVYVKRLRRLKKPGGAAERQQEAHNGDNPVTITSRGGVSSEETAMKRKRTNTEGRPGSRDGPHAAGLRGKEPGKKRERERNHGTAHLGKVPADRNEGILGGGPPASKGGTRKVDARKLCAQPKRRLDKTFARKRTFTFHKKKWKSTERRVLERRVAASTKGTVTPGEEKSEGGD